MREWASGVVVARSHRRPVLPVCSLLISFSLLLAFYLAEPAGLHSGFVVVVLAAVEGEVEQGEEEGGDGREGEVGLR